MVPANSSSSEPSTTRPGVASFLGASDRSHRVTLTGAGHVALLPVEFVRDLHFAILETYGDTAQDVLYRAGFEWGLQAMVTHAPHLAAAATPRDAAAAALKSWWAMFNAAGWGALRRSELIAPNLTLVELQQSAVAESLGHADDPVCHLSAGLFAGALSFVDRSERHGVEIQCGASGAQACRFVVGPAAQIDQAETWRQQGVRGDEILARLSRQGTNAALRAPAADVAASLLKDNEGRHVVGGSAEMLRSLRYVLEAERAGSWAGVLKATGRAAGRNLATANDAQLARAGQRGLAAQPLTVALRALESWFVEYGWGSLVIDPSGADTHGLVLATLTDSCFVELLGDSAEFADPLPAGMLQGYFEHVTGQTLAAEEIACGRKHPGDCRFAITTPERLAIVVPFIGRESAEQLIARLHS